MALSHLRTAGISWADAIPAVRACSDDELRLLDRQLETGLRCVPTSSMGRLFDAVASIAGVCHRIGYDAQAAMELEARARPFDALDGYAFELHDKDGGWLVDPAPVLAAAVADAVGGADPGLIGARFHGAVVTMVTAVAERLRDESGLDKVTLSGGVFLNALLTARCADELAAAGFTVLRHHQVPASDAGLALGQVAVLAHTPFQPPDRRPLPPEQETPCA
jgi:hydrogenase maturation protein HypF